MCESLTTDMSVSVKEGTCRLCDSLSLVCFGLFFLFFHLNEFEWLCVTLLLRPWRLSPCRRAAASSTPRWTSKLPAGRPSAAPGRRKRRREPLTQPAVPSMMGRWSTPSWPSTSELQPSLGWEPISIFTLHSKIIRLNVAFSIRFFFLMCI